MVKANLIRFVSSVMSSLCSGLVLVLGLVMMNELCEICVGVGWCRMFVLYYCISLYILDR